MTFIARIVIQPKNKNERIKYSKYFDYEEAKKKAIAININTDNYCYVERLPGIKKP